MNRLEKFLFQLTIFLIPSNLFFKWILPESYVNGILVDYLLPKLYLSDLPILALFIIWLYRALPTLIQPITLTRQVIKQNLIPVISLFFFYILFLKAVLSPHPIAAIWFWFKLLEMVVFFFWLRTHLKSFTIMIAPLTLAMLFQSSLGLFQFFAQRSLAGFWFLGETTLTQSPNIAKISLTSFPLPQASTLLITPYGTTPHSNVLAGFLAIAMVTLYLSSRSAQIRPLYQKVIFILTYFVSTITLFLTFSATAWIGLLAAFVVIGFSVSSSKPRLKLLTFCLISLVSAILFLKFNLLSLLADQYSSLRRTQLIRTSLIMIRDNPILGIGINQFTAILPSIGIISAYTSFLQPVHHTILLWLSETGLVGTFLLTILITWLSLQIYHHFTKPGLTLNLIPLSMLLIIGMFDHYPLTLQSGQLVLVLSLAYAISKTSPQVRLWERSIK